MSSGASGHDEPRSDGTPTRYLAAIAFTDIVGYSALMERDERRTHELWMAALNEVLQPQLARHRGRLVKTTGDGVLAVFASALDAVEWSCDVQSELKSAPPAAGRGDERLRMRISVHVGDVVAVRDDVYGDGVNVAARLQAFADPGGIVVSEAVHDLITGSSDLEFRDLGYLSLKHIDRPVHAFALASERRQGAPAAQPARQSLPSIAVLPLQDLDTAANDNYFAAGIVEDVVVSLASLRELFVVSRGSTLKYAAARPDPREVGRDLGVRYVLMGSVRRSEKLIRVATQLCDAQSGMNLWAENTEVSHGELFDVQDEIVRRVVAGIAPQVRDAELKRALRQRPESFSAYDHTLRALSLIHSLDRRTFVRARRFLKQAMAEDQSFAMPVAWAARWHSLAIGQGWSKAPRDDAEVAVRLAARAIDLDRQNSLALATYGHVKSFLFHDYDTAEIYLQRARAACPNDSLAWILSSGTSSYLGHGAQAIAQAEHGLRLSPFDQNLFSFYMFLSLAHYSHGGYEEAVRWAQMSRAENPFYTATLRILAASLSALGRSEDAQRAAASLMQLEPGFTLAHYERTRQPFQPPALKARYLDHLRAARLPER